MKPMRISLYGHFGAGNLGNECTLQAAIEQTLRCWPGARLLCFCTNPQDVRVRHGIAALPSEAVDNTTAERAGSHRQRGGLARVFRVAFRRIPLELVHWGKSLRAVSCTDVLIVAGTGIVADYMTGPLGWPYDIFKFSTLAALCRVKLVFLSVGVGPIRHPLSRWFLKRSLALADMRSYRDVASRQYLENVGFNTDRDLVCPDVVFGLSPGNMFCGVRASQRRVVGLGLKDYGTSERLEPTAFQKYLDTMAAFVSWLLEHGYSVRLLIGDFQYDSRVVGEFVETLKHRNIPTSAPLLMAEPALTVEELLCQMSETEVVVSPRYHNLVLALTQNKPVIALSDHAKLESLMVDFGLAQYHLPLRDLSVDDLIIRFEQLEAHAEQLRPYITAEFERYRQALGEQRATLVADRNPEARGVEGLP
jgi:polysaccharide pyruvyl transferase WcaK-like protein